jgi:gas vesicle protein GvpO
MAEKVREQRAQARERRRSLASKPFEELDQAAGDEAKQTPLGAAKTVAATAAAAALAGALAGAAKALLERDSGRSDDAQDDETVEPQADSSDSGGPEAEQRVQEDEPSAGEREAEPDEDESQTAPPTAEGEPASADDEAEAEAEQARGAEAEADEPSDEQEHESNGARGRSASDAMNIVEQAREHLKNLLGEDAESVSGIERENGNWSVTLEVVELHRIPESTDILSSYSAVLDDDGKIVSLTRGRRYRRSQVEDA